MQDARFLKLLTYERAANVAFEPADCDYIDLLIGQCKDVEVAKAPPKQDDQFTTVILPGLASWLIKLGRVRPRNQDAVSRLFVALLSVALKGLTLSGNRSLGRILKELFQPKSRLSECNNWVSEFVANSIFDHNVISSLVASLQHHRIACFHVDVVCRMSLNYPDLIPNLVDSAVNAFGRFFDEQGAAAEFDPDLNDAFCSLFLCYFTREESEVKTTFK
jgi:hypothetical protein